MYYRTIKAFVALGIFLYLISDGVNHLSSIASAVVIFFMAKHVIQWVMGRIQHDSRFIAYRMEIKPIAAVLFVVGGTFVMACIMAVMIAFVAYVATWLLALLGGVDSVDKTTMYGMILFAFIWIFSKSDSESWFSKSRQPVDW